MHVTSVRRKDFHAILQIGQQNVVKISDSKSMLLKHLKLPWISTHR